MIPPDPTQSPAYKAGQAHGAALAHAHSGAAAASSSPAAAPFTLAALTKQAKSLSAQDVNAQVAAIRAQQQLAQNQAAAHAAQINAASRASAGMLQDVGDQTAQSYSQAAKDLAALAQGYSGDLRSTAEGAADTVSQGLAAVGAPSTAVPTLEQSRGLGNLLYGLGGAVPGSVLLTAGQAQAGAQRQLPASTLGYGLQQAQGALAAGDTAARALAQDILQARAGQGAGTRNYLSQLVSGANAQLTAQQNAALLPYLIQTKQAEAAKASAPTFVGSSGTGYYAIDPASGAVTQVIPARPQTTSQSAPKIIGSASAGYYQITPDGQVTQIVKPRPPVTQTRGATPQIIGSSSSGYYTVNPSTGKVTPILSPSKAAKSGAKTRPLTAEQIQRYTGEITDTVAFLRSGVPDVTGTGGKVIRGKPAMNYTDALRYMRQHGYMATPELARLTLAALAAAYPQVEQAIAANKVAGPPAPSAAAPPGP